MRISVILPSRGLINSQTIESVLDNLQEVEFIGVQWNIFFSHNLPIPEAQNHAIRNSLTFDPNYYWFVEEDNLIPPGTLKKMLNRQQDNETKEGQWGVVACDYPQGASAQESGVVIKDGKVWWCAFGCMLVADWVFALLPEPWIRNDKTWQIVNKETLELKEQDVPNKYGGQDIQFGMTLKKMGIRIDVLDDIPVGHIKLKKEGKSGSNDGTHEFVVHTEIKNKRIY